MNWLRQLINYAIAIAVLIAVVTIVPRFAHVGVDPGYPDIENLDTGRSYRIDRGFNFAGLSAGDAIAYHLGGEEVKGLCLGWVAAVPGDTVGVTDGKVLVNGKQAPQGGILLGGQIPDRGAVVVPADHLFVLTNFHRYDSIAYGFLPSAAIAGKLGGTLP